MLGLSTQFYIYCDFVLSRAAKSQRLFSIVIFLNNIHHRQYKCFNIMSLSNKKQTSKGVDKSGSKKIKRGDKVGNQLTNVNSYRHFLALPHTGHNQIEWAFALRSPISKQISSGGSPPSTYFKTTQLQNIRNNLAKSDIDKSRYKFHKNAKDIDPKIKQLIRIEQREKNWRTVPKKDKHEDPVLIRSQSLRKSLLSNQDYENGCDYLHKYPNYSQKMIKTKNSNQYRHMIKGKISLPSICWQANLRSY